MYDELCKRAHDTAVAKGFWEQNRNMGEMLALVNSEFSEALEAHRDNRAVWLEENGKPEGVAVECADAIIRIMDILYHVTDGDGIGSLIENTRLQLFIPTSETNFGERIMNAQHAVSKVWRASKNHKRQMILALCEVIVLAEAMIEDHGADVEATIKLKMDYNDTRPYKHGKAY